MHHLAWLTPDAPDEPGTVCRVLHIPEPFTKHVMGALGELLQTWNWQKDGDMSEAECVAALETMYYTIRGCYMIGSIIPYAVATLPDGVLLCDGSEYLRVDYPALFAVLDPAYITDADHFITPDMMGRSPMGTEDDQGVLAGSLTHTITAAEMPAHNHTDTGHIHSEITCILEIADVGIEIPIPVGMPGLGSTGVGYANLSSAGGGESHSILHPVHYVKYGIIAR